MIQPHLEKESYYWSQGMRYVVGIDEAGRGPLAGPVVAGAVIIYPQVADQFQREKDFKLIRDSKTLSAQQREKIYDFIIQNFEWGVGWSDEKAVDRINILQAAYLAMKKAISDIKGKIKQVPEILLIDGGSPIPNISTKQENIAGGDKHILSIAAASIVAKVTRDRMMLEYHRKFPQYGFSRHKGYGTKEHFEMIGKYGICDGHRKSFRPCKNSIGQDLD